MNRLYQWAAIVLFACLVFGAAAQAQTVTPQGRLTLLSGQPVMGSDVVGASTLFYDCYAGNVVPVGSSLTNLTISGCEITTGLAAANVISGSLYDVFGINNSGVLTLCVGPAWSSSTSRGTGAGTSQLDGTNGGLWTNTNSLTNCWGGAAGTTNFGPVAAHAATYLGSFYAVAAGQTSMQFLPPAAAGGSSPVLGLYNAYNQIPVRSISQDSNASWTYNVASWRPSDNSIANRITFFNGLPGDVTGSFIDGCQPSNTSCNIGVNFNSTSSTPGGVQGYIFGPSSIDIWLASGNMLKAYLGLGYVQAMEARPVGTGTSTFWGGKRYGLSATLMD